MLDPHQHVPAKDWDGEGDPAWRPAVYGLLKKDGKILMLKDGRSPRMEWELPGGGMDIGEDINMALVREFKEETGYDVKAGDLLTCTSHIFRSKERMFQTVAIVKTVTLVHEEQDLSVVNQGELANEVAALEWVDPDALSRESISDWFYEALGL